MFLLFLSGCIAQPDMKLTSVCQDPTIGSVVYCLDPLGGTPSDAKSKTFGLNGRHTPNAPANRIYLFHGQFATAFYDDIQLTLTQYPNGREGYGTTWYF